MVRVSLCRICLEDGAKYPIFDDSKDREDSIYYKLTLCINELEDVEGYPHSICENCRETLEVVCNFITKYKQSCTVLQGELSIKQESEDKYSDYDANSDVESAKTNTIYFEDNVDLSKHIAKIIKPLKIELKERIKVECDIKKDKNRHKKIIRKCNKENKRENISSIKTIASSLLEGDFTWRGEQWCLKSTVKRENNERIRKEQVQTETVKKKPKQPKEPPERLCEICGEVLETPIKLLQHKKVHIKTTVECDQCKKTYSSEYYLGRHVMRKHNKDKKFPCPKCSRTFAYGGELRTHIKVVHDNIKRNKIYMCKFCDKTYKCAKSVQVHERSAHTGHRPAVCTVCDASFFHKEYLMQHMRLHTGEAPFKCLVCERSFAQRCNMKSHLRIHRVSELTSEMLSKIKPNLLKLLKS